eukprot:5882175-Ditylum_brightwellii.AAC.1
MKSFANELDRLANGVGTRIPQGTNTISFTPKSAMPNDKTVTYGCIVCDIHPQKEETHCTCLTCGSGRIHYAGNVSTPIADITT